MISFKEFMNEDEESEENLEVHYEGGVYIACNLAEESRIVFEEYQKQFLKTATVNEELHCTLIYSQKPHVDEIEPESYKAIATFGSFELFGPKEDTLVVTLISEDLIRRNERLVDEHGFISDYDEYKPHITLAYGVENIDLNSLPDIDFQITLEEEYVEPLNPDWANDNDDDKGNEEETFAGKEMAKIKSKEEKEEDE